jgi:outer membrane lipoprotein-sorting protein
MKNKIIVLFAVIALSLAGLACSFGGAAKAPEQAVATVKAAATEVQGAAGTPTPTSKPGAAPTSAPGAAGGDGPLSLQSRQAGLDKLKSYRINFTFEWKSTETGNSDSGSLNWLEEYSSNPQGLH